MEVHLLVWHPHRVQAEYHGWHRDDHDHQVGRPGDPLRRMPPPCRQRDAPDRPLPRRRCGDPGGLREYPRPGDILSEVREGVTLWDVATSGIHFLHPAVNHDCPIG